jgi:thiol-disulfide isomerase/thioredoxin
MIPVTVSSRPRRAVSLVALAALIGAARLSARVAPLSPAEPSALEAPLTNDEIVRLTDAGLNPDLIVMKIRQAPSENLDVSTAALVALHDRKVSDVVIAAIFERVAKRDAPKPSGNVSAAPTPPPPPARESTALPRSQQPKPFPDLELVRGDAESIRLSQFQGRVVLIIVWATWNGPSGKELPVIQKMADLYRDRNFVVIALNVDTDRNLVGPFLKKLGISLPVYFPSPSDVAVLTKGGVPATIILDPNRSVVDRTFGYYPDWEARWKQVVEKYVRP